MNIRQLLPAVLLTGSSVLAIACGGKETTNPLPGNSTMGATVDNVLFQATSVSAVNSAGRVYIVGTNGSRTITITVLTPSGPGAIPLLEMQPVNNALYAEGTPPNNPVWSASEMVPDTLIKPTPPNTNNVTFTTISASEASGTFQARMGPAGGTARDARVVTSGVFSVKFQ